MTQAVLTPETFPPPTKNVGTPKTPRCAALAVIAARWSQISRRSLIVRVDEDIGPHLERADGSRWRPRLGGRYPRRAKTSLPSTRKLGTPKHAAAA